MGVGVDAIEIARMEAAVLRTPALVPRLFTPGERARCTSRCGDLRFGGLAARFAAKEAVAKALGTGVVGFGFRDIEVLNDHAGRPKIVLHGGAAATAARIGVTHLHVSLSTSHDMAVANAVAEGPGGAS